MSRISKQQTFNYIYEAIFYDVVEKVIGRVEKYLPYASVIKPNAMISEMSATFDPIHNAVYRYVWDYAVANRRETTPVLRRFINWLCRDYWWL